MIQTQAKSDLQYNPAWICKTSYKSFQTISPMFSHSFHSINYNSDQSNTTKHIALPELEIRNIEKLDAVLTFLKENYSSYNDIYRFAKSQWGDNKLLYLYFSEYLRKNAFVAVPKNTEELGYAWKQKVSARGLTLDSFKNEYRRQQKAKKIVLKQQQQTKRRDRKPYMLAMTLKNFFFGILG